MESTFEVTGKLEQLSVRYHNLYVLDGKLTFLTTHPTIVLPQAHKWTDQYPWVPEVKIFTTRTSLDEFVNTLKPFEVVSLGLLGDIEWYGNIAHALFDGMYPSYLALIKFDHAHDAFVPLVHDMTNTKTHAYEALLAFSKSELGILDYNKLDQYKVIQFKELVVGTGMTGNRVMTEDYTLYGKSYYGIEHFKARMFSVYGVEIDAPPASKRIHIRIINNKRYSQAEYMLLQEIVQIYRYVANIDIKFIDWADYASFKDQLIEVAKIDIQVTGPGTGMLYAPFLKDGAVNINLGYMEHTQTNSSRPNIKIVDCPIPDFVFPGWMEQSVCAGVDYVSTLYYDRATYNTLEFKSLMNLIWEAVLLVRKTAIHKNKHNTDAQVFIEYCKRSGHGTRLAKYLTDMAIFIEFFVNEHPMALPPYVDLPLLRQIKDELHLDRSYEYPKQCTPEKSRV